MSRTVFIEWKNHGFWGYDVAVGILLKYLIDAASVLSNVGDSTWLDECVEKWRVNAIVGSDFCLFLDEGWTPDQLEAIDSLLGEACDVLGVASSISAAEVESWRFIDDHGLSTRGALQCPTAPVVELGQALRALIMSNLHLSPEGTWWLYGTEEGRTTIGKRREDS